MFSKNFESLLTYFVILALTLFIACAVLLISKDLYGFTSFFIYQHSLIMLIMMAPVNIVVASTIVYFKLKGKFEPNTYILFINIGIALFYVFYFA